MDDADKLVDNIFRWVKLQKEGAEKFDKLASDMEGTKQGCNISKVVGSSVSVGGAAAMTVAGITALATGGAAIPFLFTAGAVASGLGVATNVTSDVVDVSRSSISMKEAKEIGEKMENLEKEIGKLLEKLKEEGERREKEVQAPSSENLSPQDYVVEKILRAMAKREALILNPGFSLNSMLSGLPKTLFGDKTVDSTLLGFSLVVKLLQIAVKSSKTLVPNGLPRLFASMGAKVAGKAVGRVGAGVVGLVFSVPELVINCSDVNKCDSEASVNLRKNAIDMRKAADQMEKELLEIQKIFQRLVEVRCQIETRKRSPDDMQRLLDFAMENCTDEAVRRWLGLNAESEIFSKLVEMFQVLKEELDKEEDKNHSDDVDITFVAHGVITDTMMPASCLLPLPTVSDVVLYPPWNCNLEAEAAYGVATGKIKLSHRRFCCSPGCRTPGKKHRLKNVPDNWNSMRAAGNQNIPNIIVSPLKIPEDGKWKGIEVLKVKQQEPGRTRIIIPFILPSTDPKERISLPVVTLALSLVLMFSRFQATLHLAVCLGKGDKVMNLDEEALKQQYACTIDYTGMTSTEKMLASTLQAIRSSIKNMFSRNSSLESQGSAHVRLSKAFKAAFR